MIGKFFGLFASFFTGGTLDKLLEIIDKRVNEEDVKEQLKADVTKKWIDSQAGLLVGRTWWFQLFFIIPLGLWWTAVILDSILPGQWNVSSLPSPLDEWAGWIVSAVFLVDGGKALIGRMGK